MNRNNTFSLRRKLLYFAGILALFFAVTAGYTLFSGYRLCHFITICDLPADIIFECGNEKKQITTPIGRSSRFFFFKFASEERVHLSVYGAGPVFIERTALFAGEPFFPKVLVSKNLKETTLQRQQDKYPAINLQNCNERTFVISNIKEIPFATQLKSCIAAALLPMGVFFLLLNFKSVNADEKKKLPAAAVKAAISAGIFIYLYAPVAVIFSQGSVNKWNYLFYAFEIIMLSTLTAWWCIKYPMAKTLKQKLLSCAVSGAVFLAIFVVMLVVMADACCMLSTQSGFNFVYMVHLQRTTPHMVFSLYPELCILVYLYFIMVPAVIWTARYFALKNALTEYSGKGVFLLPATGALALVCALVFPAPFHHTFDYCRMLILQHGDIDPQKAKEYLVKVCGMKDIGSQPKVQAVPGKNLICIFMESMDAAYMEENHFPGLTPNLKRLSKAENTINFTNINSMGLATDFTFNSFYSLFMGFPLTNLFYHGVDISDKQSSLPEILKAAGYHTTFLEAGNVSLAGEDSLFRLCKIDHFYDSFAPVFSKAWNKEWGIHDDTLLDQLFRDFEKISSKHRNFAMFAATIAPHAPNGYRFPEHINIRYDKAPRYPKSHLLDAVHAEDMWIGNFVDRVMKHPAGRNTVILLVTDHPLQFYIPEPHHKNNLYNDVLANRKERKLIALAINADKTFECSTKGMLFDFAPTLLNILKVRHNQKFYIAEDLLNSSQNPDRMNIVMPYGKLLFHQYMASTALKLTARDISVFQHNSKAMIKTGNTEIPLFSRSSSTGWHGYQKLPDAGEIVSLELNKKMNKIVEIHRGKSGKYNFKNSIELYGPDAANEYKLVIRENGKVSAETKNADANKLLIPAKK